jgi:hypothetical protein
MIGLGREIDAAESGGSLGCIVIDSRFFPRDIDPFFFSLLRPANCSPQCSLPFRFLEEPGRLFVPVPGMSFEFS